MGSVSINGSAAAKLSHKTVGLGNNESLVIGLFQRGDVFDVLTMTESKTGFKTYKGASNWLARRGYQPNGQRLEEGK